MSEPRPLLERPDRDGDAIVAIATPPGRSAVALIRLSGRDAFAIAAACISPWPLEPRRATRVVVHEAGSAEVLDDAIATTYPAPRSFTGDDVVEVSSHGGAVAPLRVLTAFTRAGARPADPGEFTRRAVLAGKLDLLQAEALGDLIDAPTSFVHRAALQQLSGALTSRITALRSALLDLEALLAYDVDFPEEDDGPIARDRIARAAGDARGAIDALLETLPAARLGREGATIVLAGVPNAGKSSLFNALLGEARAIVTEYAGTTRDAVDALVEGEPYPWRLVDTAGLRDTTDVIERLGIEYSATWLGRADVVLLCGVTADDRSAAANALPATTADVVRVQTMSDRAPNNDRSDGAVLVSATTGDGLGALRSAIAAALGRRHPPTPADMPIILRARHEATLAIASTELRAFELAWSADQLPATVAAVHVRAAVDALDTLIGAVNVDDVLGRVFERFCVGK